MSQELHGKVENLRDELEADSVTELLRRSLAVYIFLWEAKKKGGELVVKEKGGKEKNLVLL